MSIFNFLSLVGGVCIFLFGMNVMGEGLEKSAGGKMESIIEKLTNTVLKGVGLGILVTAVIQSSSATTVMVVGFVNSGLMNLNQAVGVIMGANIGTTVTSWILSLAGLSGSSLIVNFLKPMSWTPILALIGIIFYLFLKDQKKKDIGQVLLGFVVLMFGMEAMTGAVAPLKDVPAFTNILLKFSNPVLGLLLGLAVTAIIQSSSASVGILQALCTTGAVTYSVALPIIMGQNIGTCVTALISSIGAKKNAKRAAFIHLYFNFIGTIVFMIAFYIINAIVGGFSWFGETAGPAGIALIHTSFNVITTLFWLPFNKVLVKLASMTIRGDDEEDGGKYLQELSMLDERFLERPGLAVGQAVNVVNRMADLSRNCFDKACDAFLSSYNRKKIDSVVALERAVDKYEDALGSYLVKLSGKPLNQAESERVTSIFQSITSFERISDHARNIAELRENVKEKDIKFSDKAVQEITNYMTAVRDIVDMTVDIFKQHDDEAAKKVEPFEEAIDIMDAKYKKHHIKRLQKGKCQIASSVIIDDLYINLERVSDHCSNVAATMIQVDEEDALDNHVYVNNLKAENSQEFREAVKEYTRKYSI